MSKKKDAEPQVSESKELTNWEQEMAAQAQAVAKTERASIGRISFKSGVMTYMDNAIPNNTLDCIVVDFVKERVYYTEKWSAKEVKPPACFALALPDADYFPHEDVPVPQSSACGPCPMNEWGSDPEGGRGKACKERRRLAVIPYPSKPEDVESSDMAVMSIPVTSLKNWGNYVNKVSATFLRPPWGVITRVSLKPDAASQFKVNFDCVGSLDEEYLPLVNARIALARQALFTPYEMNPETEEAEGADNNKF